MNESGRFLYRCEARLIFSNLATYCLLIESNKFLFFKHTNDQTTLYNLTKETKKIEYNNKQIN